MSSPRRFDDQELVDRVRRGERAALARAITMIESAREETASQGQKVLEELLPETGKAVRVGISGVPGVGKSTFIEAFGMHLVEQGHRVAVLAVDPSSSISGGSILGDKSRMNRLAQRDEAYIRPSPSATTLGGVARRTREAMLLVEAAGFDVVLVETVGVGQSEIAVADMTDFFLVLMLPGAGDELQGIKKGIIEVADLVAVNKADGSTANAAAQACEDYGAALRYLRPRSSAWQPRACTVSALKNQGIEKVWAAVLEHRKTMTAAGALETLRSDQRRRWLAQEIDDRLRAAFRADASLKEELRSREEGVAAGILSPGLAARQLIDLFRRGSS